MCGIAGVRKFGSEPITQDQITILLCANERRGNHATGLALQNASGEIFVLKEDEPAWKFVSSKRYQDFLSEHLSEDTITFLGHTRLATKGDPNDNDNNHPLFTGNTAVVHNGCISNDDELFREHKYPRSGQVDSDILRAILDEKGFTKEGISALKKVNGSVALAAVSTKFPGKLILGRSGSPLVLASTPHQLVWSSEKAAIHMAMRPLTWRFGFPMQPNRTDLAWMTMNNESVYLLGDLRRGEDGAFENALEWHEGFKTANYYTAPQYKVHDNYRNARKRWDYRDDGKKPKAAWCTKCETWITISPEHKNTPIDKLFHKGCGTYLIEKGTHAVTVLDAT